MTTYRFWSGLKTIGGNIVEIRTEKARVLCDFGLSVAGQLPEDTEGLSEIEYLIQTGNLPAIKELYPIESFKELDKACSAHLPELETAVFISHLHLDHMGGLRYLSENVKVYLSEEAYKLYNELVAINEDKAVDCQLIPFDYTESITIRNIVVSPKPSDHDSVGCSAFFIETPTLKIIHSGDFRLSGKYPEKVWKWAHEAREWETDVFLTEGTSFSFNEDHEKKESQFAERKQLTEITLLDELADLIKVNMEKLFFFNPYIRNVNRMFDVDKVVKHQNRIMVWEANYAQMLHAFYPEMTWTVLEETIDMKNLPEFVEKTISLDQLKQDPGAFVLQNSFKNIQYLNEFTQGVYLHSNGEPLGEYDFRYAELKNYLEQQHIEFISLGASGHATQESLLKVAKLVDADYTIPWHTLNPEIFYESIKANDLGSFIPEYNKDYEV